MRVSLKAARVNAGILQKEAAKAAGVSSLTIIKWEKGESSPDIEHFDKLCKLYNCTRDDIFLPYQLANS